MGSPSCQYGRGAYNEDEVQVTLTHDFEIGEHEVSQGEWTALGLTNPSVQNPIGGAADCIAPDCPVGGVSWFDALAFANRLSSTHAPTLEQCYELQECSGALGVDLTCAGAVATKPSVYDCNGYRLPTEAEWEYAARAGSRDAYYLGPMLPQRSIGECKHQPSLDPAAWYCANGGKDSTHPRGLKIPNAWGLHDTLGNAFEWTSDGYNGLGFGSGPLTNPGSLLEARPERTRRGGASAASGNACTLSKRLAASPNIRGAGLGFRLARTLRVNGVADAGVDAD